MMLAISDACSVPNCLLRPLARVFRQALRGPRARIPGVVEEERDRELHRLEVADVHDPDACSRRTRDARCICSQTRAIGLVLSHL